MADVKPIKITADVSQAEAEFQRLKAAYGQVTEAEEQFLRKVAEAETQLKAKKAAADGLGVSMGSLSSALRHTAEEQEKNASVHERLIGKLDEGKRGFRDLSEIVETSTGIQIGHVGALAETAMALGPLAGLAIGIGKAVEYWNEKEREADAAAQSFTAKIIKQGEELEKLKQKFGDLPAPLQHIIEKGEEYKRQELSEEIRKAKEESEQAERKLKLLGAEVGASIGPLSVFSSLWGVTGDDLAKAADRAAKLRERVKQLQEQESNTALQDQFKADEEARRKLMTARERIEDDHLKRVAELRDRFIKSGYINYAHSLELENKRRDREIAELNAHGARKVKQAGITVKQMESIWGGMDEFLVKSHARVEKAERDQDARRLKEHQAFLDKMFARERKEIDKTIDYKDKAAKHDVRLTQEAARAKIQAEQEVASASSGFINATFGKSKEASAASAFINLFQGISKIWATWGDMPYVAAALTAIESATVGQSINNIKSTSLGQAHSGMGEVSQTGTYNLLAGEMVLDPSAANTMREVTSAMKNVKPGGSNSVVVHFNGTVVGGRQAGREITKMVRAAVRSANMRVA